MTKGKQWDPQQETELKQLLEAKTSIDEIADKLQKTPGAIIIKCLRLGIKPQTIDYVNSSIPIPNQLPSIEETLKILAGALKSAAKPGLNRIEVQRLQAVATIAKTYKEILPEYIDYRLIENQLMEMQEENARLLTLLAQRSPNDASKPTSTAMAQNPTE